jgi:hypothetical protein
VEEVEFYLRHRSQIVEWAKLDTRFNDLLRDSVRERDVDKVSKLFAGEFGDAEVDFFSRNRSLITEWAAIQTVAGQALHQALLTAGSAAGCPAHEYPRGLTEARVRGKDYDGFLERRRVQVILAWTRQDLLTTGRGYPFPRLALDLGAPEQWQGDGRPELIRATRQVAHELGMKKGGKGNWWVHWGMLEAITDGQDLAAYAAECFYQLQNAAGRFQPILRDVIGGEA